MPTGKDGELQLVAFEVTGEAREQLKTLARHPKYVAQVKALAEAARRWMLLHPTAELLWQDVGRTLVSGDLYQKEVQGMLARSPSAFELLSYMDERTGKVASLMQAQLALVVIGVLK